MFKIDADMSIEITRGDAVEFTVTAQDNGEKYVFQVGDIVRFKVFERKGCDCVVLQKDFPVETAIEEVTISLTEADTKIGDLINKPKDYWYEVELNPDTYPQTIIGYDENGAKIFKLYPEGKDLGNDPITPEDIPFVDKELDMTSHRPVENQAIATEFAAVKAAIEQNKETATEELNKKLPYSGGTMTGNLSMGGNKVTGLSTPAADTDAVNLGYANSNYAPKSHIENKQNPHGVTAEQVGARPNTWMPTAADVGAAPGGYGYGGTAIALPADGRTDSEAELDTALAEIYGQMNDTETKLVYWNGYPAAGTSTHGWFGILTRSSVNNGGFFGWSAYDAGTTIRKVKYNSTWQPLETIATKAYVDDLAINSAEIDTLWTNGSPSSSFNAQTIAFKSGKLSDYDLIGVIPFYDISNQRRLPLVLMPAKATSGNIAYLSGHNPSDGTHVGRTISGISETGMSFANGYKAGSANTQVCVPYQILGFVTRVKG